MELGQQLANLRQLGMNVLAVSYDSPAVWRHFFARKQLDYPFLADPESKLIDALGLRNQAVNIDFMQGIPHPGVFLLDQYGRVTAKYFEEDFRERFTIAAVLSGRFGRKAAPLGQFTGQRIRLTTGASSSVVRGGQRIRLTLEAALAKGLHVYAPGAPAEFIPVSWTLNGVKSTDPLWPPADKRFQYSGTFRAARDITLPPLLKNETLVIEGAFRYQSCTNRICYPPETVPLTWRFVSESHDRERVPPELQRK